MHINFCYVGLLIQRKQTRMTDKRSVIPMLAVLVKTMKFIPGKNNTETRTCKNLRLFSDNNFIIFLDRLFHHMKIEKKKEINFYHVGMFTYEKQALEITNKMANVMLMLTKHTRNKLSKTKCEYIEE